MTTSSFALVGPRLVERGYSAIPIMPNSKFPGEMRRGRWRPMPDWPRYAHRSPTRFEIGLWSTWDGAGVGLVPGLASGHAVGVDIDTDDPVIRAAILSALPATTVVKRGARGETRFFSGPEIAESKSWRNRATGQHFCDLIGPGKQTVLPPTIHPNTRQPYKWIGPDALEDMNSRELPRIGPEHIAAIDAALAPFGHVPEPEHRQSGAIGDCGYRSIFGCLNDEALARLDGWVPQLGLYKCRRTASGFEAVAHWRASGRGRPLEQREPNLKISHKGIKDFGVNRGYSPLDLVMAARRCDLATAYCFLVDCLRPCPKIQIDLKPPA
jgi:hypothetical protein